MRASATSRYCERGEGAPLAGGAAWLRAGAGFAVLLLALMGATAEQSVADSKDGVQLPATLSEPDLSDPDAIVLQAAEMFKEEHALDARSLLLKGLQRYPDDYRFHMMLGSYYLSEEGLFVLAYRYILQAQKLFEQRYGTTPERLREDSRWKEHAKLLYLRSEAELNLDRYQESLNTLDRFAKYYFDSWYPATRAWVLMKLGRIDEGIQMAQAGLLQQRLEAAPDVGRTYNVLGILLSMKGSRELSLDAFGRAVTAERALGSLGQISTPLNNAGEVYRELFREREAEAAWVEALRLRDGCEHILPSLNLSILLTDELRLSQAAQTLSDFEKCFHSNSMRSDSEHRALLSLARGKIYLRMGKGTDSLTELERALGREQWFGKIGTNQEDLELAALVSLAQALKFEQARVRDRIPVSTVDGIVDSAKSYAYDIREWWLSRQARTLAVESLADFEDLWIRHTDAMLEYPTLGSFVATFSPRAIESRLSRLEETDSRPGAKLYYSLFRAFELIEQKKYGEAQKLLNDLLPQWRSNERLARAENLALLIKAIEGQRGFWSGLSGDNQNASCRLREDLFDLLPSHIRYYDMLLPLRLSVGPDVSSRIKKRLDSLYGRRFEYLSRCPEPKYSVQVSPSAEAGKLEIRLSDISGALLARGFIPVEGAKKDEALAINEFLDKMFEHREDPPAVPLPKLDILQEEAS